MCSSGNSIYWSLGALSHTQLCHYSRYKSELCKFHHNQIKKILDQGKKCNSFHCGNEVSKTRQAKGYGFCKKCTCILPKCNHITWKRTAKFCGLHDPVISAYSENVRIDRKLILYKRCVNCNITNRSVVKCSIPSSAFPTKSLNFFVCKECIETFLIYRFT